MTLRIPLLIAFVLLPLTSIAMEKRCGWLENPTPGNLWLTDRDATWTLSIQGIGFVADEDSMINNMPTIKDDEFVRTNAGSYGFSCVCLDVDTDKANAHITKVYGGQQLLLKQCLQDPDLLRKIPI